MKTSKEDLLNEIKKEFKFSSIENIIDNLSLFDQKLKMLQEKEHSNRQEELLKNFPIAGSSVNLNSVNSLTEINNIKFKINPDILPYTKLIEERFKQSI